MKDSEKLLTYKELFDFMLDFDNKLRSSSDFTEEIKIKHLDGSEFYLINAILKEDKIRIYIYTEHCGFFWFVKEDLEEMRITILKYNNTMGNIDIIYDSITVFNNER